MGNLFIYSSMRNSDLKNRLMMLAYLRLVPLSDLCLNTVLRLVPLSDLCFWGLVRLVPLADLSFWGLVRLVPLSELDVWGAPGVMSSVLLYALRCTSLNSATVAEPVGTM